MRELGLEQGSRMGFWWLVAAGPEWPAGLSSLSLTLLFLFPKTEKNKEELVYFGRQRWKIENEGFNMQKNGTFDIEHIYSMNYNAMKAHYFFIQFAHTIRQLLEKGLKHIAELKMSIKEVSATLTQALTQTITNLTEHKKIQLRFEPE